MKNGVKYFFRNLKVTHLFLGVFFIGIAAKYIFFLTTITQTYRPEVYFIRIMSSTFVLTALAAFILSIKPGKYIVLLTSLVTSLLLLIAVYYYRYYDSIIALHDFKKAGETIEILDMVFLQLAKFQDLLLLFDFIILLVLLIVYRKKLNSHKKFFITATKFNKKISVATIALIMGLSIFAMPLIFYRQHFESYDKLIKFRSKGPSTAIHLYGISTYVVIDQLIYAKRQEAALNIEPKFPMANTDDSYESMYEKYKGYNIVAIQVESLDHAILGKSHNGVEVTPFLNSLTRDAIFLPKFFSIHLSGSSDADAATLTGTMGDANRSLFTLCDMSNYPSLSKILKKNGYNSFAIHSNRANYYNRAKAYKELGVDKFYAKEYFTQFFKSDKWAVNDEDTLLKSVDIMQEEAKPFFSLIITITSHGPFNFDLKNKYIKEFNDIEPPIVRNYFHTMSFVDNSLKLFFDKLEKVGLRDNTIVVIYADHHSGIYKEEYNCVDYVKEDVINNTLTHVPFFVVTPDNERQVIDKYASSIDVTPTILDFVGLNPPSNTFIGNSVASPYQTPMMAGGTNIYYIENDTIYKSKNLHTHLDYYSDTVWKKTEDNDLLVDDEGMNEALAYDAKNIVQYFKDMSFKHSR